MTKCIHLDELKKALNDRFEGQELDYILWKVGTLPTIDPFATIDEMIEDIERYFWNGIPTSNANFGDEFRLETLKKIKSRLSLTQK